MKDSAKDSLAVGLIAYLLCIVGPVGLKLAGYLTVSWWFVLVAIWGPILFSILYGVVSLLASAFVKKPAHEPAANR